MDMNKLRRTAQQNGTALQRKGVSPSVAVTQLGKWAASAAGAAKRG